MDIPARVISLLPAATEMVCLLEAGDRLVGRSHECDFPGSVRSLPVVTASNVDTAASGRAIDAGVQAALAAGRSLFRLDAARFRELAPDLILTQAQCAVCAVSPADLEQVFHGWPGPLPTVLALSPSRLPDLWTDLRRVGSALGLPDEGRFAIAPLKTRLVNVIQQVSMMETRPRVACLEWLDPLMGAGNWIPDLVELAGGDHVAGKAGVHSDWMGWEALEAADPDVIVALPCGFDLDRTGREIRVLQSRPEWRRLRAVRLGRVFLADGSSYFNRPGPRLVDSVEILAEVLHPDLFPEPRYEGRGWARAAV